MKTVFSYAKSYKLFIAIALFLMLLELTVELLQPLVIAKIIDYGIIAGDRGQIVEYGFLLMGLSAIRQGNGWLLKEGDGSQN